MQISKETMEQFKIDIEAVDRVNLALLQNKIPAIRSIQITNLSEADCELVRLEIRSDPDGIIMGATSIAGIRSLEVVRLDVPNITHSWKFFQEVQEKVEGSITVEVKSQEGIVLGKHNQNISIEPETVWLGQKAPLELLVSHIMPNSNAVQKILRQASDLLKEKTGNSALEGYQSKRKERVYEIAQAIFLALRKEHITYISPPASFEVSGQKVRTPDQILSSGMGTCLDLTLIYLACLEQAGLHPIAFLVHGHAFAGFWLEDKYLPRATESDPQYYRKLIELQEIVALEITALTSDGAIHFGELETLARAHFTDESKFVCGIDVAHARKFSKIHPLNAQTEKFENKTEGRERGEDDGFVERKFDAFEFSEKAAERAGEVEIWKDKLLDLSFRNRLLNFRPNRGTIEILCENPAQMEDLLADGSLFEIVPQPVQSALNASRSDLEEILSDQITESFRRKQLLTKISEDKFGAVLNGLFRDVVNSEEETGSNTLYLALGILCWHETEGSQVVRRSPILMLPVNLLKLRGNKFKLKLRDDDSVLNMTLLQKLKRDFDIDFPGLDPLPEDESGVDVPLVFNIIRQVIRDKRGWEVKDEVWLGEFSFQKFLMWKELNNHYEKMLESPITRRIMTAESPSSVPEFITEEQVEKLLHPKDIYCPLSADSSQMAAVLSAANGSSFVLQGPPGTGKSQTIANMIAHCVGIGKRVLFVSEKKVALEVVFKRLQEIGLGVFCLELHSKKSEKKEVVKSFYKALEHSSAGLNGEWEQVSSELKSSRDILNNYFEALHAQSPSGVSAFQAFSNASRSEQTIQINLEIDDVLQLSSSDLTEIKTLLKKWCGYASELSDETFGAWSGVKKEIWSSTSEDDMIRTGKLINEQIEQIEKIIKNGDSKFPLNAGWNTGNWKVFGALLTHILSLPAVVVQLDQINDFNSFQEKFNLHLNHLKIHQTLEAELRQYFQPEVLNADFAVLKKELRRTREGFFLIKAFRQYKFKARLKGKIQGEMKPLSVYESVIDKGISFQKLAAEARDAASFVEMHTGGKYAVERDGLFREAIECTLGIHHCLIHLYSADFEIYAKVKSALAEMMKHREVALATSSRIRKEICDTKEQVAEMLQLIEKIEAILETDSDFFHIPISEIRVKIQKLLHSSSSFRDVAAMNVLRANMCKMGLSPLFQAVNAGKTDRKNIGFIFNYNFHRQWLGEKQKGSEILNNTTGIQLNGSDSDFKNSDTTYRNFAQRALTSQISISKPRLGSFVLPDSPVGLVVREHNKTRRHMPIRKFLEEIDPISKLLKPCYLMSPMSVSQYLPVSPDFDIVIFDEASQIPPWDAIGSISRGKQAIIVGDNKQLPPTAFFSNQGEGDSDEMVDCESVLQMFGSMFPEMLLKWHYRSRSESLISFSNYHIYENRLHTFPSSETDDNKVSLTVVKGDQAFYDRSGSRTNRGEAKAVVEEIFSRLRKNSSASIGVVTFSSAQATLIRDLIDAQLLLESKFEPAFDVNNPEYVFVKNLENVQGDEREIILFSIGYGKDSLGRIHLNFGPLNNSGGERRLNVAVTRAKSEVKIFANFHPREFDVSGSTSEGLRLLKEYLLYAEGGRASLIRQVKSNQTDAFDSGFEKQVATKLRALGWEVRTQIGVGGYRVDLGIVHPEYPGKYLAGIECDGARYHSARSARDRDILRQAVLEGLGWRILRIWSTDWWYDAERSIDIIDAGLKLFLEEKKSDDRQAETKETSDDYISTEIEPLVSESDPPVEVILLPKFDISVVSLSTYGDFYVSRSLVKQQLIEVVKLLSPICRDECFTIVCKAWGFSKKGSRIVQFLDACAQSIHKTTAGGHTFFWNTSEQVKELDHFRAPIDGIQRHPSTVAPEELRFAFLPILEANIQVQKSELFKEIGKMLGYSRVTTETMAAMEPGLKHLCELGVVTVDDGLVKYHMGVR